MIGNAGYLMLTKPSLKLIGVGATGPKLPNCFRNVTGPLRAIPARDKTKWRHDGRFSTILESKVPRAQWDMAIWRDFLRVSYAMPYHKSDCHKAVWCAVSGTKNKKKNEAPRAERINTKWQNRKKYKRHELLFAVGVPIHSYTKTPFGNPTDIVRIFRRYKFHDEMAYRNRKLPRNSTKSAISINSRRNSVSSEPGGIGHIYGDILCDMRNHGNGWGALSRVGWVGRSRK